MEHQRKLVNLNGESYQATDIIYTVVFLNITPQIVYVNHMRTR